MAILQELINLSEAKGKTYKVAIVSEEHWDEDYDAGGGESMVSAYEVSQGDIDEISDEYGLDGFHDIINDDDFRSQFIQALEDGSVGNKLPDVKVFSKDPDLGAEGVEGPKGYELVFGW